MQSEPFDSGFQSVRFLPHRNKVVVGAEDGALNFFNNGEWGNISDRFPISKANRSQNDCSIDSIEAINDELILTASSDAKISCVNGADYKKDLHFGSKAYGLSSSVKAIQTDIMAHGPVEAAFSVYDDFPLYKSGVYQKTRSAQYLGGHAVKVMGWGVENGTPYWLVANSWNNEWGDKGVYQKTLLARPSGGHAVKVMGWGVENGTPYWLSANSWNNEWGDKGFSGIDIDYQQSNFEAGEIPEQFDVRENWPECQEITRHVRDQSSCGSCWAFAAVSTISDRICIATKGAFKYWVRNGLVSGGDFGDKNTCRPYQFPECSHHVNGTRPACTGSGVYQKTSSSKALGGHAVKIMGWGVENSTPYWLVANSWNNEWGDKVKTPKCERKCVNGADYKQDLHYGAKSYRVRGSSEAIQKEIMTNGPVEAGFTVYDDFPLYKSGVYKSTSFKALGGHAVKIMGWGVENGTPYWLVANSWNNEWGDQGMCIKI
ncbi:hypothetical protein RND71_043723 [Anisodus tanguticus]|uniref:Peptidase C1A papain C-terminal domain-containing protein n=1 Tax=Anisodus tanguticus TaxID=243964 RepID=A0AAE1UU49_9SOLA|nr:hypothetical protein RND71_043723 [Anisodus tanguticus]